MTPDRALELLRAPLSGPLDPVGRYRTIVPQPDGALLVTILAVDR